MNWRERARHDIDKVPLGTTANSAERTPTAVVAVQAIPLAAESAASIGSNGSVSPWQRPASELTLEARMLAARRVARCRDCAQYIASPSIQRFDGTVWETPGECPEGRASPDARPTIYPFTGWHCEDWMTRRLQ